MLGLGFKPSIITVNVFIWRCRGRTLLTKTKIVLFYLAMMSPISIYYSKMSRCLSGWESGMDKFDTISDTGPYAGTSYSFHLH